MKLHIKVFLFTIFILFSIDGLCSQELFLDLSSVQKNELKFLKRIDFKKKHKDSTSIYNETKRLSTYLKNLGYFTNTIDSIKKNKLNYTSYFSLNQKIDSAFIKIQENTINLFDNLNIKDNVLRISIEELNPLLLSISKKLDEEGKSFSKIKLRNNKIKGKALNSNLIIFQSKKRIMNKVIIKDYKNFPKSFIKNYFDINNKKIFNKNTIEDISKKTKNLQFVKEIKEPEILFTKDSTILYMYLKKAKRNSFDGIVSFVSQENNEGILFNGYLDLKLNNLLNSGERFELYWNSIGNERQEFKISTEIPYLFNSKISPELSFSIYRQDSTFLNTKFDSKLFYNINQKTKLAFTYSSESSQNLEESLNSNINRFNNFFAGIQFTNYKAKNDLFFNDKFNLSINPSFGQRTSEIKINQFKLEASISYIYDINLRNSVFIKNETGYLNSESFLNNELFRIGGANSIRGFNEQSIFTNNYSYFNLEYRYLTSQKSYFYTISDFGNVKLDTENNFILGIGLGYKFKTTSSLINISTSIGKLQNTPFTFKNNQLTVQWINIF